MMIGAEKNSGRHSGMLGRKLADVRTAPGKVYVSRPRMVIKSLAPTEQ